MEVQSSHLGLLSQHQAQEGSTLLAKVWLELLTQERLSDKRVPQTLRLNTTRFLGCLQRQRSVATDAVTDAHIHLISYRQ